MKIMLCFVFRKGGPSVFSVTVDVTEKRHGGSGAVGGWGCAECPHSRVFGLSALSAAPTTVARQPFSNPTVLGGGIRSPVLPPALQVGGCVHLGNCRVHPSGCPSVRLVRLVPVRGDPLSAWISRPYLRFPGSDPASTRGLNGVTLYSPRLEESRDALTYLLSNVEVVFESYE